MRRQNGWGGRWQNGGSRWSQGFGGYGSWGGGKGGWGGKGGGGGGYRANPFQAMMQSVNEVEDFRCFIADAAASSSGAAHPPLVAAANPEPAASGNNNQAVAAAAETITTQIVQRVTENLAQHQHQPSEQLNNTMNGAFGASPPNGMRFQTPGRQPWRLKGRASLGGLYRRARLDQACMVFPRNSLRESRVSQPRLSSSE